MIVPDYGVCASTIRSEDNSDSEEIGTWIGGTCVEWEWRNGTLKVLKCRRGIEEWGNGRVDIYTLIHSEF